MPKLVVQFVSANAAPQAPLKLDIEKRDIMLQLGEAASLLDSPAARLADVLKAVRKNQPNVVHFSAHGTPLGEIVLLGPHDEPWPVPRASLEELFRIKSQVRLVLLSACFSIDQAQGIVQHIDCVIGVDGSIPEEAARLYCVQFYDALASGRSVKEAHGEARVVLIGMRVAPEKFPQLLCRKGVDAGNVYVSRARAQRLRRYRFCGRNRRVSRT